MDKVIGFLMFSIKADKNKGKSSNSKHKTNKISKKYDIKI